MSKEKEFDKLTQRYIILHAAYVKTVKERKLIQAEKDLYLEDLHKRIVEINKLHWFWNLLKKIDLVLSLIYEINDWRDNNNADLIKADEDILLSIDKKPEKLDF